MSVGGSAVPRASSRPGKNATTMSAISIHAHGMTKDDNFVICACSLDTVFFDLDATFGPHATCGGTTEP
jgi:hypothetical protein